MILTLLVIGAVGVALDALMRQGQATLPITDGLLAEGPVEAWAHQWGFVLTALAVAWSGIPAYLQWGRAWERGTGWAPERA